MPSLNLVSLNVEKHQHIDRVERFLVERSPDVVCLQEVRPEEVERFAKMLGNKKPLYVRSTHELTQGQRVTFGNAIISTMPLQETRVHHYVGDPERIPDSDQNDPAAFNATNRMVLLAQVEKDSAIFKVATTHFTWSARGEATDEQRESMRKLLKILADEKEFVLSGDFNAPRGGEIFTELSSRYKDNIPSHYKTSIDASLHRNGKEYPDDFKDKMVDGLFTTPAYKTSDVVLHPGISDHYAITASISRVF